MDGYDRTADDSLQEVELKDSKWLDWAQAVRKISSQFGLPMLLLFAAGPRGSEPIRGAMALYLFIVGTPGILGGVFLRLWSRGYRRVDGFVVDGPYRYVRNPVELGAMLIYTGSGVLLGLSWLYVSFCLLLALVYLSFAGIASDKQLTILHGGRFFRYSQRIGRWWPNRLPAANRTNRTYSLLHAVVQERESLLWVFGFLLVLALRQRFF